MKKNNLILYLVGILLLVFKITIDNQYLISLLYAIILFILIYKFGLPADRSFLKKSTIRIVIISIFSYLIIIYGLGLITGYNSNIFNLSLKGIVSNTWYIIVAIVTQELIRYIYSKQINKDKKTYIYLSIIYICIAIIGNNINFNNHEQLFKFICLILIPTIANHTLYSYLTYKSGFVPSLILRLVFELYIYFFPIIPNLGNYLTSLFSLFYPLFIYLITSKLFKYYNKEKKYISSTCMKYIYIPIFIILIIIVSLVSGIGKHQLIVIASGSMEPIIYRGDAVIYEKNNSIDDIKIGTILAYKKNNIIITHRVIGIDKEKGLIKTKGDNNNMIDDYDVLKDEILGIVVYNIKYIGFPTIWLNEKFGKL